MIYLDNAASMPVLPEALDILNESMKVDFANPSANHRLGKKIKSRIEDCRKGFLQLVSGESSYQFIFTSSATESNNQIINNSKGTILISHADHSSVIAPAHAHDCRYFDLDEKGFYQLDNIKAKLDGDVSMLILTHVNGQSGSIGEIIELGKQLKKEYPRLHLHIDGVQAFGKIPLDLSESILDSYTISSHKTSGPKGVAGLYIRKTMELKPLLFGGGHEFGLRSSTLASPLIFSFYEAAKLSFEKLTANFNYVQSLSLHVQECLVEKLEFPLMKEMVSPYILMAISPNISSDIILRHLEREEIYISSSSACSSKVKGDNPIFTALGIPSKFHKNVLRISFSAQTTHEEVAQFITRISEIVEELKKLMR